jgi:long-chain fatty acid transport protein
MTAPGHSPQVQDKAPGHRDRGAQEGESAMRRRLPRLIAAAVIALLGGAAPALATNGYFAAGYGMIENGRGGVGIATTDDAMGGANNPATMAFAPAEADLGLYLFMPSRSASRSGNAFGLNGSTGSGANDFVIPELGVNVPLGPRWDVGLTIYGNGGMNTTYPGGQIPAGYCGKGAPAGNLLCGVGTLGVDLTQVIIAPTLAFKPTPRLSLGIAPLFAVQHFAAQGLQAFAGVSSAPTDLTNRSYDNSYGGGVRIGLLFRAAPTLNLGLTYQTRIYMTNLSRYAGLFAGAGGFDIPAQFGAGLAWQVTPTVQVAADYERIFYSSIPAVGNPSASANLLGTNNGPGFGWHDINVFRLGVDWRALPWLTLRAGYNHGGNPVSSSDVTFNILAPGIVTDQASVGFSWVVAPGWKVNFAYDHAFKRGLSGPTSPLLPGGGTDHVTLEEDEVGLGLSVAL